MAGTIEDGAANASMTGGNRPRLFDTHAHFFTNDIARYPVDLHHARESTESLRHRLETDPVTAERVLKLWDAFGVAGGAAVQYNSVYKTDNSYTLDVSDAHPERISAVLILDSMAPETPDKLRTLAARHNVAGLRLFGFPDQAGDYPWLDAPSALKTWDAVAACGLHMILMYAPGVPSFTVLRRIIALARRYPDTIIILDHCGWPGLEGGIAGTIGPEHLELADIPNIYFKFTEINVDRFAEHGIDCAAFIRLLVDTYGHQRVMWGSDFGNTISASYGDMVERAVSAATLLTDEQRDYFLFVNGDRLFGGNRARP
jgi:L-fuconolactonase